MRVIDDLIAAIEARQVERVKADNEELRRIAKQLRAEMWRRDNRITDLYKEKALMQQFLEERRLLEEFESERKRGLLG